MTDGHKPLSSEADSVYVSPEYTPDEGGAVSVGRHEIVARPEVDHTPVGFRKHLASHIRELVVAHGDTIREQLATPEVAREYCDTIRWGLNQRPPDRTCLNQYAQVMKLVGEERRITVEFIHSLGARDEAELKRLVDAAKSVEGAGPHDGAERCVAYLEAYLNVYPEQRAAAVKRLGGYVPVEMG